MIPYFISSHPASELEDMANLAAETKDMGFQLEQVQGFTPTPMTVATVIYYSGYHPYTLQKINTPRTKQQREDQHRFFFWYKKENQKWIRNVLSKVKRTDLLEKLLPTKGKNFKEKKTEFKKDKKKEFKSVLPKQKRHQKLSLPSEFPEKKSRNQSRKKKKKRRR